ncbi:MAG: wax ester/triacylglycerol synthase family O-acyltransferase [Rhodocyclaceae bacterium]|nr:wax ester/triacylglycerol synthase family O-acyltransferase [Rhodocyclaceae bacterium]
MDHLSGLDAAFLHLETPETPMHVGGLSMYELPPEYKGDFVADVVKHIQSRMHLAPIFQRKLVNMPFDLANPVWVMDDHLDIEHHIRHVIVPPPGSRAQVDRLVSRIHSSLLDRSRPLWEMYVLDGLPTPPDAPKGTRIVGVYSKFHHAGLDGMGGQVLMQAIMDTTPEPRQVRPAKDRRPASRDNFGIAELAGAGIKHNLVQTVKLVKSLPGLIRTARRTMRPAKVAGEIKSAAEKTHWFAPRTPLNVGITNQRSFARFSIPIKEVKEITAANKVSLNDVVMEISSEGMMRYLADMGCRPKDSLLAAVPVSLRPEGNTDMSNQVSMARMSLASNIKDPIERLQAIRASSQGVKSVMTEMKTLLPTDFPSIGAPWLFSALANGFARSRLANTMPAFANVVISNVPGPNITLYFAGAKQISTYPVSIPYHGMALNITLQSYNGWLDFGLIGCRRVMPDIADLGKYMQAAHAELLRRSREMAAEAPAATPAKAAAKPSKPAVVRKPVMAKRKAKAKLNAK